jgi:hypothetical protein
MFVLEYAYVLGASLGLILAALAPAFLAWVVAIRHKLARDTRLSFAVVCALLSYGVLTGAALPFIPLDVGAIFLAPQLDEVGYKTLAAWIFALSEYSFVLAFVAAAMASVWVPLRLRHSWPGIIAAYRDGNALRIRP